MKNIKIIASMLALVTFVSCKKKDDVAPPPPAPVVVETPAPPPPPPTPEATEESDGTSINVGKDGVDINTKDGAKKTSVKVGDGDAKVEVKK